MSVMFVLESQTVRSMLVICGFFRLSQKEQKGKYDTVIMFVFDRVKYNKSVSMISLLFCF